MIEVTEIKRTETACKSEYEYTFHFANNVHWRVTDPRFCHYAVWVNSKSRWMLYETGKDAAQAITEWSVNDAQKKAPIKMLEISWNLNRVED